MTVNNSQNIHDYLELTSADESMKLGSTEVIPPQLLSVTQKDMSFNDQLQHAELTVFPDLPFKPVPDVKESVAALDAVPPYYNATTASDIFVKPLESFEEVKRISYMDVPEVNRISYMDVPEKKRISYMDVPEVKRISYMDAPEVKPIFYTDVSEAKRPLPEVDTYSKLELPDHYDSLASVGRHSLAKPSAARQHKMVSKKCITFALFCYFLWLLLLLVPILATIFVFGNKLDNKLDAFINIQKENFNLDLSSICPNTAASDLRVTFAGSCYCLYRKRLSWESAKEFCLSLGNGVHLAEIYTKEANDFLLPLLQASNTKTGIWLGGSELLNEGRWMWNYTEKPAAVFTPYQWSIGQPSRFSPTGEREQCLEVYNWNSATFMWNDINCNYENSFLCKSSLEKSRCSC